MFSKMKKRRNSTDDSSENHSEINSDIVSMFLSLQEKLNSPLFNGGFDKLFLKVENIEANQKQTSELIDTINKTIYEPDDGLFSRIKHVEKLNSEKLTAVANAQEQLKLDLSEVKQSIKDNLKVTDSLKDLKIEVEHIKKWKDTINKGLWILIPAVGGTLVKFAWDFVISHVVFR